MKIKEFILKIYEEYFELPEEGKIREKVFTTRIAIGVIFIGLWLYMMGFSAYAYFTYSITSGTSTIQAASYDLDVKFNEELLNEANEKIYKEIELAVDEQGYYILQNNVVAEVSEEVDPAVNGEEIEDKVFEMVLSKPASATAKVGYAKIEILTDVNQAEGETYTTNQLYYTAPIGTYLQNEQSVENNEYKIYIKVPAGKTMKIKVLAKWGTCARGPVIKDEATFMPDFVNSQYMHISFDDVECCLTNLVTNKDVYKSIYDEPFVGWLKTLHETYGAKFSLYTYTSVLENYVTAMAEDEEIFAIYKTEFAEAKDWLKIGLHAESKESNFGGYTYDEGKTAWNTFVGYVVQITGSYDSVDRMPRLKAYAGSEVALQGMREADKDSEYTYGAIGFLAAEDSRQSYYLDETTCEYLYTNDYYVEEENESVKNIFVATDMAIEWFKEKDTSVYDELVYRYGYKEGTDNAEYANSLYSYIIYGNEGQFYNADGFIDDENHTREMWKTWFEQACKFANDYYVNFNYPQTRVFEVPKEKESEDEATVQPEDEETAQPNVETEVEEEMSTEVPDVKTEEREDETTEAQNIEAETTEEIERTEPKETPQTNDETVEETGELMN